MHVQGLNEHTLLEYTLILLALVLAALKVFAPTAQYITAATTSIQLEPLQLRPEQQLLVAALVMIEYSIPLYSASPGCTVMHRGGTFPR